MPSVTWPVGDTARAGLRRDSQEERIGRGEESDGGEEVVRIQWVRPEFLASGMVVK